MKGPEHGGTPDQRGWCLTHRNIGLGWKYGGLYVLNFINTIDSNTGYGIIETIGGYIKYWIIYVSSLERKSESWN